MSTRNISGARGEALLLWHCCCDTVVVTVLLWQCCCDTVVLTLLWQCCCDIVVVTLLWHCCCDIVVANERYMCVAYGQSRSKYLSSPRHWSYESGANFSPSFPHLSFHWMFQRKWPLGLSSLIERLLSIRYFKFRIFLVWCIMDTELEHFTLM